MSPKKTRKKRISLEEADALVVGAGSFGTAIAHMLGENGKRVLVWTRSGEQAKEINEKRENVSFHPGHKLSTGIQAVTDLDQAISRVPILIIAVPVKAFREVARKVGNSVAGDQIILHVAKGIELKTYKRMSEILREETCVLKIGVISGPTLSKELMAGNPAGALVASHFEEVVEKAQGLFLGTPLRLYGGQDIIGTEVGGAFKNIIALMAGAAAGMGFGDNTKSLIITRGLSEMAQYGVALGADVFTFGGLAGIGDLMATCSSPLSRNHQVGRRLAAGETLEQILETTQQVAEGVPTTKAVYHQMGKLGLDLNMVTAIYDVLYNKMPLPEGFRRLMERPAGRELVRLQF
jgi:glycerol-3-phosphate dehydrogenase (NAD(P)+)